MKASAGMSQRVADPTETRRYGGCLLALIAALALAACATPPAERRVLSEPAAARLPPTQVYFYPTAGQTRERQDRDRYECYLWAVKQTGFDPSQPRLAAGLRVEVVPMPPPGHDTALGAVSGALIGAAVSHPHDAGEGAVIGAVAGAVLGAASDASRQAEAERIQARYEQRDTRQIAQLERRAQDYRRAMSACLEGRGYAVH